MSYWSDHAEAAIDRVHAALPADVSLEDRKAAVDAAYPFGQRKYWPYKAWLKARRAYLVQYGYGPKLQMEDIWAGYPRDPVSGRPMV